MPPAVALLNYMTIKELYYNFVDFSRRTGIFLYIINFARRISEAVMAGRGARSAPFCVLKNINIRVCTVHKRALAAKTHSFSKIGVYQIYEE